jgi:hypothetical protein
MSTQIIELNGVPMVTIHVAGVLLCVVDIETDGAQILTVHAIANPDKLHHLVASSARSKRSD